MGRRCSDQDWVWSARWELLPHHPPLLTPLKSSPNRLRVTFSPADTMGCCSGRCTLIFICTLQLVSCPTFLFYLLFFHKFQNDLYLSYLQSNVCFFWQGSSLCFCPITCWNLNTGCVVGTSAHPKKFCNSLEQVSMFSYFHSSSC